MQIECDNCGNAFVIPDDLAAGQSVHCPHCNAELVFEEEEEQQTASRPVLQHTQASGRGTQSEHELAARHAAVDAIERRIEHNEGVRRTAAKKRMVANLGSFVVAAAVLGGIAYYFTHGGVNGIKTFVTEGHFSTDPYAEAMKKFGEGELSSWADAPSEIKPKNAKAGAVYFALVPKTGMFSVYQLTATTSAAGKKAAEFQVKEFTSSGSPVSATLDDFNKACNGHPYFILYEGYVYVGGSGSSDRKEMDKLRKAILSR